MPTTIDSTSTSCYKKSRNRCDSNSNEDTKIFKTKVDLLNCKPEDVKLKMEGNRIIIEGKLFNDKHKEKPTHFSKHYIMPENCDLKKMRYTITSDGVYIEAPKRDVEECSDFPRLEDSCTNNCVDLNDRFEIRLNVQDFKPEDIKIKVNGNTITIKAKRLEEVGMKRVIKTYSLPDCCEITRLERRFTPQGHLILSIPKFLGLFCDPKKINSYDEEDKTKENVKCKFNITAEKFEIKIDVSNYRPDDINIIQQKRMVTIEGKSKKKMCKSEETFEKTFVLPADYDISKIDRKFHSDGVLVVSVPRAEGKMMEDFKTFLPENAICDMKIKDDYVEIKLDTVGFEPEEITIKLTGKNTITIEGKQVQQKGRIAKSFMKSYLLPTDCDNKKIKKHLTSNGVLIVRIPRNKRSCSLENLSDILDNNKSFASRGKSGSLDNLSEPDEQAMVDSAELDNEKFEMKFNVHGFSTEDIYVKINKNVVTVECKHPNPGKGIVKSYFVPKAYNLNALHTYITHDDILVVTIPRFKSQSHIVKNENRDVNHNDYITQKIGDNYIIKVDIRGYRNNDISLDVKGQTIIVQGGHLGNQAISKSFSKKFIVPPNYHMEALTYHISAEGFLIVEIPQKLMRQNAVEPQLYRFPEHKATDTSKLSKNQMFYRQNSDQTFNLQPNIPCHAKHQYSEDKCSDEPDRFNPMQRKYALSTPNIGEKSFSNTVNSFGSLFDSNGNEIYQVYVDVRDCYEEDINVRLKGNNVRVEGKKKYYDGSENLSDFVSHFSVPEEFDMKGLQTRLENGMLIVEIPKYKNKKKVNKEIPYMGKDLLSNVKIGQENIIVEMDASGLKIEDFEISTCKNVLTIAVLKGDSDRFKTKVDLPDNTIIDGITKTITSDGKLLVTVPRKNQSNFETCIPEYSVVSRDYEENSRFIKNEKRKSCLVLSKTAPEKSKSVKFLVDGFENETAEDVKFATLPRSTRCKSYNSVFLEEPFNTKTNNQIEAENFELKIFVPHHEPDEVVVKIRGDTITIEGKKKNDERNIYFSKNFFKTYIVPKNIDTSQLKTTFSDNYLIITAPRIDIDARDV
ncbi:uncharacterized protein LOC123312322 [Coccinella septempunctata]|uniref:uncharacterized protein LOC123312322 n=1 Tax=Coccinella septempunctata TaxID=41139 RepID=UPI001D05DA28|nr:uncharacterized protein LOC123312322 [Coccinella septempunctata]